MSYFARLGAAMAHRLLSRRLWFALQIYDVILADLNAQHAQQPVGAVRALNLSHGFQVTPGNEHPLLWSRPRHGSCSTRRISLLFLQDFVFPSAGLLLIKRCHFWSSLLPKPSTQVTFPFRHFLTSSCKREVFPTVQGPISANQVLTIPYLTLLQHYPALPSDQIS